MKKLITLLLAVGMTLVLCSCGEKNAEAPAAATADAPAAVETATPEVVETTEDTAVYADDMFAVEDIVYEIRREELKNFEIKIRNLTDTKYLNLYFRVQGLDTRGDVLAAWNMGSQDGLEPGQGYWYYCSSNDLFEECRSIEEAAQRADALRVTYVKIQTVKDDPSSWVEYEFAAPPTFRIADIQPKG
jgi:hypothetical protein